MKTEVVLQRHFMGSSIGQKSKSGLFSASDLVRIVNRKRAEIERPMFNLNEYLRYKSTIIFIEEIQKQCEIVVKRTRGRNAETWVHPFLFIDIALACDPKFKVEVYGWLYDELLKHRNNSGDSYKKMCGYLYDNHSNKSDFPSYIIKVAKYIRKQCRVEDWNKATPEQLLLRDTIHNNISLLTTALRENNEAVRLGITEALKNE